MGKKFLTAAGPLVALCRPGPGLGRLDRTIARRSVRHERIEQLVSRVSYLLHRVVECSLVGLGGSCGTAQLADELEGGRADLFVRGGRLEVMQRPNVSAHEISSLRSM